MKLALKKGDIDKVYLEIAEKHKLDAKIVKKCLVQFFDRCSDDIKEMESGDEYRILKVGLFKKK